MVPVFVIIMLPAFLNAKPQIIVHSKVQTPIGFPTQLIDIAELKNFELNDYEALKEIHIFDQTSLKQTKSYRNFELAKIIKTKLLSETSLNSSDFSLFIPESFQLSITESLISELRIQNELIMELSKKCKLCNFKMTSLKFPNQVMLQDLGEIDPSDFKIDYENLKLNGNFLIPLMISNKKKSQTYWISGTYKIFKDIYLSNRKISRGEAIKDSDIALASYDITHLLDSFPLKEDLLAQTLVRDINISEPIFISDIKKEFFVQKGALIKIIVENDTLEITGQATAEESGYLGNLIKVKNLESQKILLGKIIDKGIVRIE